MKCSADATAVKNARSEVGFSRAVVNGMIMLGSVKDMEGESLYTWSTARDLGGITACVYIVVPDPDAHCLHARNEGAVVVDEPHDNPGYPGRGYTALDPEGNVWSFGSYDPWTD